MADWCPFRRHSWHAVRRNRLGWVQLLVTEADSALVSRRVLRSIPVSICAWMLTLAGPAGCTTYRSEPLPNDAALLHDVATLSPPAAATVAFDVGDGLDPDEVAAIAVLNNPGLRAAREGSGIAHAQLFAAKLLPDPQLTLGSDRPTNQRDTTVSAFTLGIGYDVGAVVARNPTVAAAEAATEQVRLDVIWQEWQVAQQARIAAVRYRTEARKLDILRAAYGRFEARAAVSAQALDRRDVTVDVAGSDLSALLDMASRLGQLEVQHADTGHEIDALLGLLPTVELPLVGADVPPPLRPPVDVASIAQWRPDLLALQAGYRSQEARVRLAVWHQFPAVTVTWNRMRDTSSVWTSGFAANLNLPFFSGARGEIAIERATRAKLRAEYQDRLAQTQADVARLQTDGALVRAQFDVLQARVAQLDEMAVDARRGYRGGELAAVVSINLDSALVTHRIELIDLEQTLWEARIALDTLLGRPQQ